jgi:hypothetical protein
VPTGAAGPNPAGTRSCIRRYVARSCYSTRSGRARGAGGTCYPLRQVAGALGERRGVCRVVLGPIKNKPVVLGDGSLLYPSSTEHLGWRIHLERTADLGESWETLGPFNRWRRFDAIQTCIPTYPDARMQGPLPTRQRMIAACWSNDGGRTWGPTQATSLPKPGQRHRRGCASRWSRPARVQSVSGGADSALPRRVRRWSVVAERSGARGRDRRVLVPSHHPGPRRQPARQLCVQPPAHSVRAPVAG